MGRAKILVASTVSLGFLVFLASLAPAQVEIGDVTITGEAEVSGLPRNFSGDRAKFEEYRDIPETAIVPQLQLMIGSKKEDFYASFDTTKPGRDDQNFRLRFGRYGLLDMEFEWDQIPHIFSVDTARTPYVKDDGGGTFTLASKPASTAGTTVRDWVNANAAPFDLKLFNGIGRFNLRYTPTPGWTFTGNYRSYNSSGKRAFGAYFGPSPGSYNITELTEPIDYQTHNIELGGEYAGKGWSLGLKYSGSLFHNNVSTLVWDNPINLNAGCASGSGDTADYRTNGTGGPCRGRIDLYPSNQAHTFSFTGTTALPLKSHFLGTVSYGFRKQNDPFLPFTINSAITQPSISRESLDGDVRPLMVNATLVNRYWDHLDLKAYYRLYDFDNRSKRIFFPQGIILNDQAPAANCAAIGTCPETGVRSFPYAYSRQNVGLDGGYDFAPWLHGKLSYGWEKMHREEREVLNADEHSVGPTFDIKPNSWVLVRASYRRFWRSAPNYDAGRQVVIETTEDPEEIRAERLEALRKFDEAARHRDKSSLFAEITPQEQLAFHAGFEAIIDRFSRTEIGVLNDFNYSPSIGLAYRPSDWVTLFADYNWERFDWKMRAMQRSTTTQTPDNPADQARLWISRGRDQVNTVSFGSDSQLVQDLLGFRLQYGFSESRSLVRAGGSTCVGCTPATDYPAVTNRWHELLARFEYKLQRNTALRFGYYYNRFNGKDFGVDIMKPWMGDVDTGANVQRSIFLGDRIKGPFTAHMGFLGVRLSF